MKWAADLVDSIRYGLNSNVDKYLKQLVWHRLDKISPLMSAALGITLPDYAELMRRVATRPDIAHRGGKTKDGEVVTVSDGDLAKLRGLVETFVGKVNTALQERFPIFPTVSDSMEQLEAEENAPFRLFKATI